MTESSPSDSAPVASPGLRLSFLAKLIAIPMLAGLGFTAVAITAGRGQDQNGVQLDRIERTDLPAMEKALTLRNSFDAFHVRLGQAVAAENAVDLAQIDGDRRALVTWMSDFRALVGQDDASLRRLEASLGATTLSALETTRRMVAARASGSEFDEAVLAEIARMQGERTAVAADLDTAIASERARIAASFATARRANEEARARMQAITLGVFCAMTAITALLALLVRRQLQRITDAYARVRTGDFSRPADVVTNDELGDVAKGLNTANGYLVELVRNMRETAAQVNSAAAEMSATALEHQRGATDQSRSVEETQRTMQHIVASTEQINGAIDAVLQNAEQTQAKNALISESIVMLSTQADGISEILTTIRDVANKAELLALNAALEGTKAGEVGRGFSLVATQMQRLAENVQRAVGDIKALTETIRRASTASVLATEEGIKLATDTTRSAREIRVAMQHHQSGTQQIATTMADIATVAQLSAASSRQVLAGSEDLAELSKRLLAVSASFKLPES